MAVMKLYGGPIMLRKKTFFCYWNGSHDSALSLYRASKNYQISFFMTHLTAAEEGFKQDFVPVPLLRSQADACAVPLFSFSADQEEYEQKFTVLIQKIRRNHIVQGGVFAEISRTEKKNLNESICQRAGIESLHPLWHKDADAMMSEFTELGFKAKVISINEKKCHRDDLGRDVTRSLMNEFRSRGIDISGANGDFKTFVYDGPLFSHALKLKMGDITLKNGYWNLDIQCDQFKRKNDGAIQA